MLLENIGRKQENKEKSCQKEKPQAISAPEEEEARPMKRKWLKIITLGLGMIFFILGFLLFLLSSRVGYPNYRIIFLTAVLIILYYMCLFVCWLMRRIFFRKKG